MNYLLDTDTCVYALRGRAAVRERLAAISPEAVAISIITLAELRYGAACSTRPTENHQTVDDFVQGLHLLGMDTATTRLFGELIEDFDLVIAATALTLDLTLITNNVNHFRRIPGLHLENWA